MRRRSSGCTYFLRDHSIETLVGLQSSELRRGLCARIPIQGYRCILSCRGLIKIFLALKDVTKPLLNFIECRICSDWCVDAIVYLLCSMMLVLFNVFDSVYISRDWRNNGFQRGVNFINCNVIVHVSSFGSFYNLFQHC